MDFLRDPLWQFIGAFLTLTAIFLSIYFFMKERKKKSLSYEILVNNEILTVGEEVKGKVQILYNGAPVQNVQLLTIKLTNDGNVPITSSDFERSLSWSFGDKAIILSAEITNSQPETLKPEIIVSGNNILLTPTLLNSKDSIEIKHLISELSAIKLDSRIIGIRALRKITRENRNFTLFLWFAFAGLVLYGFSLLLSYIFPDNPEISLIPARISEFFFPIITTFVLVLFNNILGPTWRKG